MRAAFIDTLMRLAEKDSRVCLLTGDLGFSVLEKFKNGYPGRFINVGVAEANMIGLATGLALDGWLPYVYSIATFASMRGYEQIRNGPVLHGLPVRIIGIGGGFAYSHAGPTHHALEDYALMRVQPGLTVIAPADPAQTQSALIATADLKGPIYYRIGKGGDEPVSGLDGRFSLDGIETIGEGEDLLLLSTGAISARVAEIACELGNATAGIVATLNPVPDRALSNLIDRFKLILSVEEHYRQGGLGSIVAEVIARTGKNVRFRPIGVHETLKDVTGSRNFLWKRAGLDHNSLVAEIKSMLENR